eukprot:SAG31_NODE_21918_length_538_cov_0.589977_2_plen_60_part_01
MVVGSEGAPEATPCFTLTIATKVVLRDEGTSVWATESWYTYPRFRENDQFSEVKTKSVRF